MTASYIELIFNLLVHLSVLWWFLTSFFFLYVRHIESQKIYEQLGGYIGDRVQEKNNITYGQNYDDIVRLLNGTADEDIDAFDRALEKSIEANVELKNERVLTRAIAIGTALTGVTLFYYAWFRHSISLTDVLAENMMVFVMIGAFEYLFFTRYGLRYEPVDPNEMLRVVREYKARKKV